MPLPVLSEMSMTARSGWVSATSRRASAHVGGFAADLQVGLPADPRGQRLAHGRVVIDDQDPWLVSLTCVPLIGSSSIKSTRYQGAGGFGRLDGQAWRR